MTPGTLRNVVNLVLFQIGWFACVLSAASGSAWLGILTVVAIVVWHLRIARRLSQELALLSMVGVIGFMFESLQRYYDILVYAPRDAATALAPLWMAALWINFATTLNLSLRWFKQRKLLAVAAGAVAGPIAYYGGMNLGALTMPQATVALSSLAIGWGLIFPLCLWLADRFDGFGDTRDRSYFPVQETPRV
jgi:hypothetical protein